MGTRTLALLPELLSGLRVSSLLLHRLCHAINRELPDKRLILRASLVGKPVAFVISVGLDGVDVGF